MKKKKKNIFRHLFSDFVLFLFSIFVLSSLISMHLRLIFHVNILNETYVAKKKEKDDIAIANQACVFYLDSENNKINFRNNTPLSNIYFIDLFHIDFVFIQKQNLNRAPPYFV